MDREDTAPSSWFDELLGTIDSTPLGGLEELRAARVELEEKLRAERIDEIQARIRVELRDKVFDKLLGGNRDFPEIDPVKETTVAYATYHDRLAAYFRRRFDQPSDVADALQDTFVGLLTAYRNGARPDDLERYIFTIARNLAANRWRAAARKREVLGGLPVEYEDEVVTPYLQTPYDRIAELGQLRKIRELIDQLPDRQRDVFASVFFEELTPAEVAERLGISPNLARVNLHHARRNLARRLGMVDWTNGFGFGPVGHEHFPEDRALIRRLGLAEMAIGIALDRYHSQAA